MAKNTTTKKTSSNNKETNGEGAVWTAPANITLVTNGYRSRLREDGSRKIAKLKTASASATTFKSQDELQKAWEKSVTGVPEDDYVLGAGDPGIFSARFAEHITQIASVDNVWCPSTGLGLVNLGAMYPQYDLGDADADIKLALPKGTASDKDWWSFVCELSGNSMMSVIMGALKKGNRVIMAIPGIQYFQYRPDLQALVAALTKKDEGPLLAAREQIRFVGPELEAVIPPKLLPCVMPYDKAALDRLVPGVRSHGTRRIARLLLDVVPTPKDGRTSPIQDFEAMQEAFKDAKREPITYSTGATEKGQLKKLSDEEAEQLIQGYADEVGNIPQRIVRMMREDGYAINSDRVSHFLGKKPKSKK